MADGLGELATQQAPQGKQNHHNGESQAELLLVPHGEGAAESRLEVAPGVDGAQEYQHQGTG